MVSGISTVRPAESVTLRARAGAEISAKSPIRPQAAIARRLCLLTTFISSASPCGSSMWWARQQPYEAAFLEKFLSLSKMLVHRVPTEIPTTGEEDWSGTQSVAALVGLVYRGV